MLVPCAEMLADVIRLVARGLLVGGTKTWDAEVAVVLGNLVFQDQVVAKSIPREVRQDPVILMAIVAVVGEDEVRREGFQRLERRLDARAVVGKKIVLNDLTTICRLDAGAATPAALRRAPPSARLAAEYHPLDSRPL